MNDADMVQQIKAANDVVDVVGTYVALRPAGQTFKGLCPFHDDGRPSFDVDPRRQRYRCWSCGKHGDVFNFVMEMDRITFPEALEMLARRAGISLEKNGRPQQNPERARMLEVLTWADQLFQQCLLEEPTADAARRYLTERRFTDETLRRFGVGYAPLTGDWLVRKAQAARQPVEILEQVGLIAKRDSGTGYYDRFRERVMFPIRDQRGRTVGFGGRILPTSAYSARGPKYYNSCESPLFCKSDLVYALDLARKAGSDAGYLAIVEGYTDVLMAHQHGVGQVVATMGTALTARHVQQIRRHVPRIVLVYDADEGGNTGVDRALELVVRNDVELKIARLPEGLDPFDLLVQQGPQPFVDALASATDVLDFKLEQVWRSEAMSGLEGRRRAIDALLKIIALGQEVTSQSESLKRELMLTRIAQRSGLREEALRARLGELRREVRVDEPRPESRERAPAARSAPAPVHERELLEVLLAEPGLVAEARQQLRLDEVEHLGLRKLLEALYALVDAGVAPTLDELRLRLDHPALLSKAQELQAVGENHKERTAWLVKIVAVFKDKERQQKKQQLQLQLQNTDDDATALGLLRQLQRLEKQNHQTE